MVEELLQEVGAEPVHLRAQPVEVLVHLLERAPHPPAVAQHQDDERGGAAPSREEPHGGPFPQQGVHRLQQLDHPLRGTPVKVVDHQQQRSSGAPDPQRRPRRPLAW
jgi:hypothetical protein